jgi:glycosyltransferase involved in cell wall biosynthesis
MERTETHTDQAEPGRGPAARSTSGSDAVPSVPTSKEATASIAQGQGCVQRDPPLRVLFLIDSLWVGGTERSLVETLPHLARTGIDARVAVLFRRSEGLESLVPLERLHHIDARGWVGQVRALRRLVRSLEPDIVHAALWQACMVSRLACVGLQTVLVNSLVNAPYTEERLLEHRSRRVRVRVVQLLDLVSARLRVDRFHAVSQSVATAARRTLGIPLARTTVIGRGRDPARLGEPGAERRREVRARLGIEEDVEVVLSIGRQYYQKGQELLVRALARISGERPRSVLWIAGREGNASALLVQEVARCGVGERVRFLGHRDDVPDLLAAADVFAFPSRFEGYPGAVLEAMGLGLPVVASAIGPVLEILEPEVTGLVVPSGDEESLAAAIARVLSDRELAERLGVNARRRFMEQHTIDVVAGRMAEMYRSLAASAP